MSKLVVIVQCELVTRRCSGYNCMKAFTQRSGKMEGYPEDTRYMAVNCGGCCGAGID
ncbi:MAG: CGGC domain-containing protein, partial [Acidaminococcaceae bacterium]|nr:CGGC domain-containing protein [Acidaminococcaceae bacterium]